MSDRAPKSAREAADLYARLPRGTLIPAEGVAELLAEIAAAEPAPAPAPVRLEPAATWRERLWTCPAEVRLGVKEAAEALGRPVSWVYRRTSTKASEGKARLPFRKFDNELTFVAGELRSWLRQHEHADSELPMESTEAERWLRAS